MGYVYFANFFVAEWRELDKEFRDYIPSVGLVGIGLFLVAIRNVEGANKFLLLALGVLISVSVPAIAGLRFLMETDFGQSIFSAGIAIFSVLWFLYFIMKKGKDEQEKKDIVNARPTIIGMFLVLIAFSLVSFVTIETLQNLLKYDS